jgi:hypothetical protein
MNENNNRVLDLYTSEVTTQKAVLSINNKKVIHVDNIPLERVFISE